MPSPKRKGVKIVSKLASLQGNCLSKRVGWTNILMMKRWRWYKENVYLIWPYKQQSKTDFTFHKIISFYMKMNEWTNISKAICLFVYVCTAYSVYFHFTILASNKRKCAKDTVDFANAISVDSGRFNFSHLIIHEFFKMCHLFVYISQI